MFLLSNNSVSCWHNHIRVCPDWCNGWGHEIENTFYNAWHPEVSMLHEVATQSLRTTIVGYLTRIPNCIQKTELNWYFNEMKLNQNINLSLANHS